MHPDNTNHNESLKRYDGIPWCVGMTSLNEQKYLRWFAEELYGQKGEIVELGCWLGSLTQSICKGLLAKEKPAPSEPHVHVYDLFEWEHNMEDSCQNMGLSWKGKFTEGDNYFELYKEIMKAYMPFLRLNKEDLNTASWDGKPIELLVVDAMKYESLCDNITRQFYPSLIEGTGYLVHQDFLHFYESWIHVSAHRLRDYIAPVYEVPDSGSMVFKCLETPPLDLLGFETKIAEVTDEEIDATYAWALALADPKTRNILGAAHTMAYIHKKDFARAKELYQHYRKEYPPETSLTPDYYQLEHLREYILRFGIVAEWPSI